MQIANVMKIFCKTAQQIKHRTTQNESKNLTNLTLNVTNYE